MTALMKSNNIFYKWPCEGHYPCAVTQRSAISSVWGFSHVRFRRSIADWKMSSRAFQGANGWPFSQGVLFLPRWLWLLMARFRGEEGHVACTPHLGPCFWLRLDILPPGSPHLCRSSVVLPRDSLFSSLSLVCFPTNHGKIKPNS